MCFVHGFSAFLGGACYIKLFFKMKKIHRVFYFQSPLEITRFPWLVHWRYLVECRQDDLAYFSCWEWVA